MSGAGRGADRGGARDPGRGTARAAWFIALRYLLGRAGEGGRYLRWAAAGIALSLVPIVVTLIVADGMIRGITDRYLELGTGHIQIYDYLGRGDDDGGGGVNPALADAVRGLPGLRGAWEETRGLGVLVGKGGSRGATIRAVDKTFWEDEGSRRFLREVSGEARLEGDGEVLLGEELARSVGVGAGDTVRLMTARTTAEGRVTPRVAAFTVRGVVSSGYRELDALWCLMTAEAGRRFLPADAQSFLLVKIERPYDGVNEAAATLYRRLGSGYGVYTWQSLERAQFSSYASTRQLLLFIMALIVLVAAVNVSSATSMLAFERQRDIAVLKAAGARPGFTTAVFLWGGLLTGGVGTAAGLAAGLAVGASVNGLLRGLEAALTFLSGLFHGGPVRILDSGYYLETIPIIIDWGAVGWIGALTVASAVAAAWAPARRAGRIRPMEILRKY